MFSYIPKSIYEPILSCYSICLTYDKDMTFHVITIFPHLFDSYLNDSILKRAIEEKKLIVKFYNPRDVTKDKHKKVDDIPYGGGPGMVMQVDPIMRAYKKARGRSTKKKFHTVILSPGGEAFTTSYAKQSATNYTDIILICGRYEGIDSRVQKITQAQEISIGDYVLTGGELAAMVMIDSIARQVSGVLGNSQSLEEERVSSHEMYTRPSVYTYEKKTYQVPDVLMSGDHKKIESWRKER